MYHIAENALNIKYDDFFRGGRKRFERLRVTAAQKGEHDQSAGKEEGRKSLPPFLLFLSL